MSPVSVSGMRWLIAPATMLLLLSTSAAAQTRSFKKGDRVYVRYITAEGYGTVKGSDAFGFDVELENQPIRQTRHFPRDRVYESREHAQNGQLPAAQKPPLPDLGPLYQAIGAAMVPCFFIALLAIYFLKRRSKSPSTEAIDAEIVP